MTHSSRCDGCQPSMTRLGHHHLSISKYCSFTCNLNARGLYPIGHTSLDGFIPLAIEVFDFMHYHFDGLLQQAKQLDIHAQDNS